MTFTVTAPTAESIVRRNLMEQPGYAPYCGAGNCRYHWPRAAWDGEQFKCGCGWRSSFEEEFITRYKVRRAKLSARNEK